MTKKSYAKVNIFLKISGKRGSYHELVSRFVRVHSLFDEVTFKKGTFSKFTLAGEFGCTTEQNTIYKAYKKLESLSLDVKAYFQNHKVIVNKNIPEFAGLGGGSSNCATFMIMVNEVCNLGLSKDELSSIGATIGADVPFFIYEYESANVTGIGEIVKKFDEPILNIKTFTPPIQCNTGDIFTTFRDFYYKEISQKERVQLLNMSSIDILDTFNISFANDLYLPAVKLYSELTPTQYNIPPHSHFSGSGSSFFYINK